MTKLYNTSNCPSPTQLTYQVDIRLSSQHYRGQTQPAPPIPVQSTTKPMFSQHHNSSVHSLASTLVKTPTQHSSSSSSSSSDVENRRSSRALSLQLQQQHRQPQDYLQQRHQHYRPYSQHVNLSPAANALVNNDPNLYVSGKAKDRSSLKGVLDKFVVGLTGNETSSGSSR